jgi:hypothetical protein
MQSTEPSPVDASVSREATAARQSPARPTPQSIQASTDAAEAAAQAAAKIASGH